MKFVPLEIEGAFVVAAEPVVDERGFFARSYCAQEFADHGMASVFVQASVSSNRVAGTLRGMHYADPPERKLVRPTRGVIWDVLVDLRPASPTYRRWVGVELSAADPRSIYIPAGVAHGFQTLADDTEVEYLIDRAFDATSGRGARWDDPAFGIRWPMAPTVMSERDRAWAAR